MTASLPGWGAWHRLEAIPTTTREVVAETLDGGQAFRWTRQPADTWIGIWSNVVVRVRLTPRHTLEWSAPAPIEGRVGTAIEHYFGRDTDFDAATSAMPWRSDPHLARCIEAFPGLRILRQPFGETLLCFLCSATKQIVQIKQMVALLARRHGEPICRPHRSKSGPRETSDVPVNAPPQDEHFSLPTWERLAEISETELRKCLLGFRAKYIAQTASFLAKHPSWLDETESLPYAEAKERLCSLPGVGEKVADCVLLFGAGRLEAFPVDVWILKTMAKRYGLEGWKPRELTQFGRAHFGAYAGLAQQFLFAWERQASRA